MGAGIASVPVPAKRIENRRLTEEKKKTKSKPKGQQQSQRGEKPWQKKQQE